MNAKLTFEEQKSIHNDFILKSLACPRRLAHANEFWLAIDRNSLQITNKFS